MADEIDALLKRRDALAKEITAWQSKAAVAKADEARLKKEIAQALSELKTQFGCSSYEEAVTLLEELKAEASDVCDQLEEKLSALRGN